MKIAVTAATGRLGQAVLHKLVEEIGADQVLAIARDPAKFKLANIQCLKGDYNSESEMSVALAGVDTVVMISAPVTPGTDRIELHRKVIKAAKQACVRKMIFTSVIGGDNEQNTLFAATQAVNRQAEADLQASGLDWIVERNGL